ncbi:hypothetical protein, partial [Limosilactobacillus reuteri]|uniref:hypothetical protein n=2 Tax=Limosilactobacillus reuteri TaxID=1598 RepID=UPI001CDA8C50
MKKYSNIFINIFYVPLIFISLLGILENLLTQISNMSKWSAIFLNFLIFGIVFLYILKNIKVPILNGKIFNYLLKLESTQKDRSRYQLWLFFTKISFKQLHEERFEY